MRALSEPLPTGERMLWQGKPGPRAFLRQIFHPQLIVAYVGLLLGWCLITGAQSGHLAEAAMAALRFVGLSAIAMALFAGLAWGLARSSTYTITTARIVIEYGLALPKSVSIPFASIDAAAVRDSNAASGDIVLTLRCGQRVPYLLVWPHVRPGSLLRGRRRIVERAQHRFGAQ